MVTKFHMGLLPTLVDKIMHNNFGLASIWPQKRLSSQVSQKYIEPTLKCKKKEEYLLHFYSKIFIFQQLFLWIQIVVLDQIYWIYKKFFDFACSIKLFWPPKVVHPKWAKMAKNGFFGPFDSPSYKKNFTEAYPTMVSGAFWRCHHRLPACMKWIWNSK